jgi:hypothetical protein
MTGFHVDPDRLDRHAAAVAAIGRDVADGAAAEVSGTAQADFGVLIGATLGSGIRALAGHFEQALRATASGVDAAAVQLWGTSQGYRDAEAASRQSVSSPGGSP